MWTGETLSTSAPHTICRTLSRRIFEEILETRFAIRSVENIVLFDLHHGKPASVGIHAVIMLGEFLFSRQQFLPLGEPLASRNNGRMSDCACCCHAMASYDLGYQLCDASCAVRLRGPPAFALLVRPAIFRLSPASGIPRLCLTLVAPDVQFCTGAFTNLRNNACRMCAAPSACFPTDMRQFAIPNR
jgi:hypothetical protein